MKYDAIIISDLHLGAKISQLKKIQLLLSEINTRILIINGDLLNSYGRLSLQEWLILKTILSGDYYVIWVKGNHDEDLAELIGGLFHVTVVDKYILNDILIIHGHQFDEFILQKPTLTLIVDWIYNLLQRFDLSDWATHWKTFIKINTSAAHKIERESIKMAVELNCFAACCGHTHIACHSNKNRISYFNSGSFVVKKCSYITIKDKEVKLNFI